MKEQQTYLPNTPFDTSNVPPWKGSSSLISIRLLLSFLPPLANSTNTLSPTKCQKRCWVAKMSTA